MILKKIFYVFTILNMFIVLVLLVSCDKPDPEETRKRSFLPPFGFKGDAIQGDKLFHTHCADCHGKLAMGSNNGPPLIHKIYEPGHHADLSFYRAARNGVPRHHWQFGNMPPVENITPEEVAHIIAYVRKQQRRAGIK